MLDRRIYVIYGPLSSMDLITKVTSVILWINVLSGKAAALLSIFMFSFTFVRSFEVGAVSFFYCLFISVLREDIQLFGKGLESQITCLTPPQCCACPKSGAGCASANIDGFVVFNGCR